jgi:RimJ/RimL family protein N-acetyltransferase
MFLFRALSEEDLQFLNEIRNDCAEDYLHDSRKFTLDQTREWFHKVQPDYYVIQFENTDIGYFRVSQHSELNKNLYIGADLHKDFRGKKLAYPAYIQFISFLFNEYGLNKISLEVLATNVRAYNLYKKLGFIKEGVKRQEIYKEGTYIDSIVMSILKEEFYGTVLEN